MTAFNAKAYRQRVLETVETFFDACHLFGKPSLSFPRHNRDAAGTGSHGGCLLCCQWTLR